ncbi:MAG TPA: hypothetical protein VF384_12360 [Planctomycetota bacterium]
MGQTLQKHARFGASRPVLGSTFQVRFASLPPSPLSRVFAALGFSDQTWGSVPLPINLTAIGFSSCSLWIEPGATELLSNAAGVADWNIAIPAAPSLDGQTFFLQGLVLAPDFNPGGAVMSASRRCRGGVL